MNAGMGSPQDIFCRMLAEGIRQNIQKCFVVLFCLLFFFLRLQVLPSTVIDLKRGELKTCHYISQIPEYLLLLLLSASS